LTFQLSRQYFAVRSDRVRQILPASDIREVRDCRPYLQGSIATNGRLVPVVDVRERLAQNAVRLGTDASVLIMSTADNCPLGVIGVIADKLSQVIEFQDSEIRGTTAQRRIDGRPFGRPKTIIELDRLLTAEEWAYLQSVCL
jgi:purine-binding chemotaxis protein CheW